MPPIEADALGPNIAAVAARGQGGAVGVSAQSDNASAIVAVSENGAGVYAESLSGAEGVLAKSAKGPAVFAASAYEGVHAEGGQFGVYGQSASGIGVYAVSGSGAGIHAVSESAPGVEAESTSGPGAKVSSQQATGILSFVGFAQVGLEAALLEKAGHAIAAITNQKDAAGVMATGSSYGVHASSANGIGVYAHSDNGIALQVDGYLHIQGPAVGKVMALRGESSWQVQSPAVTEQSIILLTPLANPGAFLWIDPPAAGSFTIHASQPLPLWVTIQYLIIN